MAGKEDRRDKKKGTDYDLVPPEGGWGFVICIGLTVGFIAGTAHLPCLGFIYREFLEDLGEGTSALASVQGLFNFMTSIAAFAVTIALKRFSLRFVGVCGAIVLTIGAFLGIFVQSTFHLLITNGVLQGFGFGIMIPILYTSYNSYFTVKKVLYLSLCKAGIGLIIMIYPLAIKLMMEEYGFRGTLAVICAIMANSIAGAMVMHPVSWHMVKKPKDCELIVVIPPTPAIASDDSKNVFNSQRNGNGETNNVQNGKDKKTSISVENLQPLLASHKEEDNVENVHDKTRIFLSPIETERRSSTPVVSLASRRRSSAKKVDLDGRFTSNDTIYTQNAVKSISLSSLANSGMDPLPAIKNKEGRWQTVVDYLDLNLLKDPVYTNIAIGMSFSFFADIMFFALEPLLLGHYRFSTREVANIISVGGAADMAGKLTLGLVGQFYRNINSRYVFYSGSLVVVVLRTIFLQFSAYLPVLVLTGMLGLLRSTLHITMPLVMAAHMPIERYPAGWGLMMLIYGIINLTFGPMIGMVRDYTGNYPLAFHLLSACNLLCVVPWTSEAIIAMCRKKSTSLK